uniref:Uncharacterized protein n=1 Tax=Anatid alphaherpesvirus 2 TaxID=3080522 RepID=A0AAU0K6C9_9ALPH
MSHRGAPACETLATSSQQQETPRATWYVETISSVSQVDTYECLGSGGRPDARMSSTRSLFSSYRCDETGASGECVHICAYDELRETRNLPAALRNMAAICPGVGHGRQYRSMFLQ